MKITTVRKFEKVSKEIFGYSNISSLFNFSQKIRFDLGGEFVGNERVDIAYQRAVNIFQTLFNDKEIWLKVIIWDKKEEQELTEFFKKANISFKIDKKSFRIFYLNFNKYDPNILNQVLKPILGFELGYDYGLNIKCIYYNFESKVILNVYDDRGMDVLILDRIEKEILKAKFSNILNYYEELKSTN
ncbi:DUF3885 domain-containing protein [Dyadobacter bucti]|uniref:DUF3885 domain-containing protein n=1 Tax=Dyadobacter bucti TaxID=2572203 RepID=UPI003F6F8952